MESISSERKATYYVGQGLTVVGLLCFFSFFFMLTDRSGFGPSQSAFVVPFLGIVLISAGRMIANVGARGLAGSGVLLDPKQAREDLKPYSAMAGDMVNDALERVDVPTEFPAPQRVVMLKCRECEFLNQENAKYCQECGAKM